MSGLAIAIPRRETSHGLKTLRPLAGPPIRFTPRTHITIRVRRRAFNALIDTGSEASFVNAVHALNFTLHLEEEVV